jgi:RNA polymerase sigma factor (sigma-70 family)
MITATVPNQPRTQLSLLSDGRLLAQYAAGSDQDAFAVLVQRHGPTILGVCRRVLRHEHDTEDAFQATFMVLARKAHTISKHDSVASWLYKVAYRIALRLRMDKVRQRAKEQRNPAPTPCSDEGLREVVRRELQQVLDEEIHRLPEKYRAAILLCYLQGETNEQAATLLHCPTGTIKIRLLRGREMLRKRLLKRGLALSATALLGEVLKEMAQAAVAQPLARAATQAAVGYAAPKAATLAGEALKGLAMVKLKVAALVLLTLGLTCLTDGLASRARSAQAAQIEPRLELPDAAPASWKAPLVASRERY